MTPKAKFIFDNYKVQADLFKQNDDVGTRRDPLIDSLSETKSAEEEDDDFFSFFASHEKIIMKPESSFKNLRSFLVSLPIDYYILLQDGYQLS